MIKQLSAVMLGLVLAVGLASNASAAIFDNTTVWGENTIGANQINDELGIVNGAIQNASGNVEVDIVWDDSSHAGAPGDSGSIDLLITVTGGSIIQSGPYVNAGVFGDANPHDVQEYNEAFLCSLGLCPGYDITNDTYFYDALPQTEIGATNLPYNAAVCGHVNCVDGGALGAPGTFFHGAQNVASDVYYVHVGDGTGANLNSLIHLVVTPGSTVTITGLLNRANGLPPSAGPAGTVQFFVTPEPSTALLLGAGLAGLAAAGRRRKEA